MKKYAQTIIEVFVLLTFQIKVFKLILSYRKVFFIDFSSYFLFIETHPSWEIYFFKFWGAGVYNVAKENSSKWTDKRRTKTKNKKTKEPNKEGYSTGPVKRMGLTTSAILL